MRDLLVIVPSRGRPERLREMTTACLSLSEAATDIAVALDDDDAGTYDAARQQADPRISWHCGPRDCLTGWTNRLALRHAGGYRALASLGDDHMPRTPGWDRLLLEALARMGGTGIAYPDDRRRSDIPEAAVISADIVAALGWICLPGTRHFYVDNAWADLGREAGCISYCPHVVVEHMHYLACPGVARDATYAEAEVHGAADRDVYEHWRKTRMAGDVAAIRALRGVAA